MATSDVRSETSSSLVGLCLIVGSVILLGLFKDVLGGSFVDSTPVRSFLDVITFKANADSWFPMYQAALEKVNHPEQGIYQTIFYENKVKFQYPPISLLPFMIFVWLGLSWGGILYFMNLISFLSMFGIAISVYVIATSVAAYYNRAATSSGGIKILLFLLLLVGTFFYYPILRGQFLGQIQIILDLLISLTIVAWLRNRKLSAGIMISMAALIKPQIGLLLIWGLLRKERRFCAGMFMVAIPAGIVSLAVFGFNEHLDYLAVLSYIGRHGEIFWANQSMNGLLNRLLSDVSSLQWEYTSYAPFNVFVYAGTLVTTIGFLLFGLLYRPKWVGEAGIGDDRVVSTLYLATFIVAMAIASPIAWEHHYGVMWPVIILMLIVAINLVKVTPDWMAKLCLLLIILGYYLTANFFAFAEQEEFSRAPLNLLQSYIFFGGVILLLAAVMLRNQMKLLYDPSRTEEMRLKPA